MIFPSRVTYTPLLLARGGLAFRDGWTLSRVRPTGQSRFDADPGLGAPAGFRRPPGGPVARGGVRAVRVVLPTPRARSAVIRRLSGLRAFPQAVLRSLLAQA